MFQLSVFEKDHCWHMVEILLGYVNNLMLLAYQKLDNGNHIGQGYTTCCPNLRQNYTNG